MTNHNFKTRDTHVKGSKGRASADASIKDALLELEDGLTDCLEMQAFLFAACTTLMASPMPIEPAIANGSRLCADTLHEQMYKLKGQLQQTRKLS